MDEHPLEAYCIILRTDMGQDALIEYMQNLAEVDAIQIDKLTGPDEMVTEVIWQA